MDANNQVVACPAGGGPPAGGSIFPGTQIVTIEVDSFKCTAPAGTNQVVLPNCTSWQVPGSTTVCEAAPPNYNYPFDNTGKPEAIPGSPSKCNCSTIPLGITVQSPTASVAKTCDVGAGGTDNNANALCTGSGAPFACCTGAGKGSGTGACGATDCTLSPEGGSVTYTIDVNNISNFGDIVVDQICDSAYGNIFTANGFGGTPCPAGTDGSKGGTTCSALTVAQGADQSCTFTATQDENKTVTDTVSIIGHGSSAGTFGPTSSNSVQVTSNEAASTATITKTLVSTTAGCATVRYAVDVHNSSSGDEDLTLSTLSDSLYGGITSVHGSVLGTTCGVASGQGSLSGSGGAGTLPQTLLASGSYYTCQFDAQFCGALGPVSDGHGGTCQGLQNTDSILSTITGDEGETVTKTNNSLTVSECITGSSSSSQ